MNANKSFVASNGGTVESGSPVDWSVASGTGRLLVRGGPVVPKAEAEQCVRELREVTVKAEGHVRELTGMGSDLPLLPGEVVDRPGWVRAATEGLAALTDEALASASGLSMAGRVGPRLGQVLAGGAGVQAGMVLAFLAARVLGQYDPFGGSSGGRLLLVAPNVLSAEQAMEVPPSEFRLWVCLHECTHRLQFTAVPWLRDYFSAEVNRLLSTMDKAVSEGVPGKLAEVLRTARQRIRSGELRPGPAGLIELLQGPEQRRVFDGLLALSTLLEGHADYVMDAVGPAVVPSVATIRARFADRRNGGGLLDRVLRVLLGVDAKIRQYAEGAAFTRHVINAVGITGFNVVWTSPETLPLRAEITDPDAWLHRVHG